MGKVEVDSVIRTTCGIGCLYMYTCYCNWMNRQHWPTWKNDVMSLTARETTHKFLLLFEGVASISLGSWHKWIPSRITTASLVRRRRWGHQCTTTWLREIDAGCWYTISQSLIFQLCQLISNTECLVCLLLCELAVSVLCCSLLTVTMFTSQSLQTATFSISLTLIVALLQPAPMESCRQVITAQLYNRYVFNRSAKNSKVVYNMYTVNH